MEKKASFQFDSQKFFWSSGENLLKIFFSKFLFWKGLKLDIKSEKNSLKQDILNSKQTHLKSEKFIFKTREDLSPI